MPIPVQDIIDRVADLLLDTEHVRWTEPELIRWINDSRAAILTRRPAACSKVANISLVTGTAQSLPADGVSLLDVIRNMGLDGNTPGRAIRRTDRQAIDDHDLYWHTAIQSSEISQFSYDERTPRMFFVNPPAIAGVKILAAYAALPAQITSTAQDLDIALENMDAVVNYVCFRAKSKDSEYANAAEAAGFYGAFNDALGVTSQNQAVVSPNQPGNSV